MSEDKHCEHLVGLNSAQSVVLADDTRILWVTAITTTKSLDLFFELLKSDLLKSVRELSMMMVILEKQNEYELYRSSLKMFLHICSLLILQNPSIFGGYRRFTERNRYYRYPV